MQTILRLHNHRVHTSSLWHRDPLLPEEITESLDLRPPHPPPKFDQTIQVVFENRVCGDDEVEVRVEEIPTLTAHSTVPELAPQVPEPIKVHALHIRMLPVPNALRDRVERSPVGVHDGGLVQDKRVRDRVEEVYQVSGGGTFQVRQLDDDSTAHPDGRESDDELADEERVPVHRLRQPRIVRRVSRGGIRAKGVPVENDQREPSAEVLGEGLGRSCIGHVEVVGHDVLLDEAVTLAQLQAALEAELIASHGRW